jgi:DMSO/TMAO reductase YedYZ molybdopterin-dependent catalytic subunit
MDEGSTKPMEGEGTEDDEDLEQLQPETQQVAATTARSGVPLPAVVAIAVVLLLIGAAIGGLVGFLVTGGDDEEDDDDDSGSKEPALSLDVDSSGFADAPFSFKINITGVDASKATITWTFGDGSTATGATAQHIYSTARTYDCKVEVVIDGKHYIRTFVVTVQAIPAEPGILPAGDPMAWTLNFTGACAGDDLTIADLVSDESAIVRSNITLEGKERSFLGLPLPYIVDLADARFDAGPFTAIGVTTYSSSIQRAMFLPRNDGNETLLVFAEGGKWLNGTEFGTPLMLLGEDPAAGDVVKNLKTIDLDPFRITVDGPGIVDPIEADYDLMVELGANNYTVMDGTSTFVFTGVPVLSLLEEAGLARNATTVKVGSTDGYVVDFLMDDVFENPESSDPFFLAFKVDGEYLPALDGPYRLITPDADYTEGDGHNWYHQTWIKTVAHIEIETSGTPAPDLPWGSPVEGTLNVTWDGGFKVFTSDEIAGMWAEIVTMNATMVNKAGTATTNIYSGIPLLGLLGIAGAPFAAGSVTVVAGDGYSKTLDAMEIYLRASEEGNDTMVALTEGGSWLPAEKGPFRLVGSPWPGSSWISQLATVQVGAWSIDVNGTAQSIDGIQSLAKVDLTVESKGKKMNYTGCDLLAYLTGLGMGPGIGSIVVSGYDYSDGVITKDGYSQSIDLRSLEGSDASEMPILAYELEGSPMGYDAKGPLRLIVPTMSSKYWIGAVTSIEYVPWSLTILIDGVYHNMTVSEIMAISDHDGTVKGLDGTTVVDRDAVGVFIADLLIGLGANLSMNVTFKDGAGNAFSVPLGNLSSHNATGVFAMLAWELDGATLYAWTGLFILVLPDDIPGDDIDWTIDQWLKGVVSIEV